MAINTVAWMACDVYRARLEQRFFKIAEQPLLYPSVAHIRAGYRKSVLDGLSIYYREGDDVVIVRLIERQNPVISAKGEH